MDPCRVAIIGAGRIAEEHARAFHDVPSVEICGVMSRTRDRAETFAKVHGVPRVCDTIDELYHSTLAQLVVVTVTETDIFEVTMKCLEYPWCILIEKPPGLNLNESVQLAARARRLGRNLYVAMNRQSYSVTREVRKQLSQVEGPRFIHVQDQEDPEAALRGGKPKRSVDHWMYANSIHLVDYFRLFARGQVQSVNILQAWQPDRPCVALAHLTFTSGDFGIYEAVWRSPGPWAVSVTVPGQRWEMRPLERATYQTLGQKPVDLPIHQWDSMFKPGFRYQAEQAVRSAFRRPYDLPTADELLTTMKLITSIYSLNM